MEKEEKEEAKGGVSKKAHLFNIGDESVELLFLLQLGVVRLQQQIRRQLLHRARFLLHDPDILPHLLDRREEVLQIIVRSRIRRRRRRVVVVPLKPAIPDSAILGAIWLLIGSDVNRSVAVDRNAHRIRIRSAVGGEGVRMEMGEFELR